MKNILLLSILSLVIIGLIVTGCTTNTPTQDTSTLKEYVLSDSEQCKVVKFACNEGKTPFFDEKGCGCISSKEIPPSKVQAVDCTDPRPVACTKEYMPVCGQMQVECIKAPCDLVKETFANKCTACANPRTISYFDGACESSNENPASGTVPAGTRETQCIAMGGEYLTESSECVGIDNAQCTELGGTFNECASACRNDPKAEVCTLQCVIVCQL